MILKTVLKTVTKTYAYLMLARDQQTMKKRTERKTDFFYSPYLSQNRERMPQICVKVMKLRRRCN